MNWETIKSLLINQGRTVPVEMRDISTQPDIFCNALTDVRASHPYGGFVNARTPHELNNFKLFLSDCSSAGCAVEPDGNITAVFKHYSKKDPNITDLILLTALGHGGCKLDCYAGDIQRGRNFKEKLGHLPLLYKRYGFVPVAQVPFDPDYADEEFVRKYDLKSDVLVFAHNGDSVETIIPSLGKYKDYSIEEYMNLPKMPYYDALKYRDHLIEENNLPDNRI